MPQGNDFLLPLRDVPFLLQNRFLYYPFHFWKEKKQSFLLASCCGLKIHIEKENRYINKGNSAFSKDFCQLSLYSFSLKMNDSLKSGSKHESMRVPQEAQNR